MHSRLLLGVYNCAWGLAKPLLRRHKRLREDFSARLVPQEWPFAGARVTGPVIWVQAASGGEAWLVHSLVDALQEVINTMQSPCPVTLLCTTWTRQGLDVLQKLPATMPGGMALHSAYFPLDVPEIMRRAVAQAAPSLLVLLETELWPGLLLACHENRVPVLAVNARMTEKSLSGYRWLGGFWRECGPQRVLAISGDDASRFATLLGPDRVTQMHNMKFDRVHAPAAPEIMKGKNSQRLPFVALASTREEEEAHLFPVVEQLLARQIHGHPVSLAIAPRHMHRVANWEQFLTGKGIRFCRRSDGGEFNPASSEDPRVLLWSTFGEMNTLYEQADAVFVGGSLAPLGGQNFLEPLEFGRQVFTGPSNSNFHWVGEELYEEGLVKTVPSGMALATALENFLHEMLGEDTAAWDVNRSFFAQKQRECFLRWLKPFTGGSRMAAEQIFAMLPKQ